MKKCIKCLIEKPFTDFYKHKQMSDEHLNKCKECKKIDVKTNYRKNINNYKEYEKGRSNLDHRIKAREEYAKTEEGILAGNRAKRAYDDRNPKVKKASTMVANALRDGTLTKPLECTKCGSTHKIEGHHCDYDKPLDVIWLCVTCHNDWHKTHGEGYNKKPA
jgi:hypothetical protein